MILGVIPARGGSKGLPGKNRKIIAGKPLLTWTIEAAQRTAFLNRLIVSTEDIRVASVARDAGCEVLLRPAELAKDEVSTLAVLQHAVDAIPCDTVVLLQPTSPIRREGLIDTCVERFQKSGCDSLATGFICKFVEYGKGRNLPRQQLPGFFYDDGNVYVIRADLIRRSERFGEKQQRVILSREENVEIDDEFDFWLAEQVLLNRSIIRELGTSELQEVKGQ